MREQDFFMKKTVKPITKIGISKIVFRAAFSYILTRSKK